MLPAGEPEGFLEGFRVDRLEDGRFRSLRQLRLTPLAALATPEVSC